MTPAQLDKLRRIDAHLANLLSTAEKRTPGEWAGEYECVAQIIPNQIAFGEMICEGKSYYDMDFIAAAAGNAEAGWKATRAAIHQGTWLIEMDQMGRLSLQDQGATHQMLIDIIAAFPNV